MTAPTAVPQGTRTEVPKLELHVHLEGTVEPATLLTLARRNGLRLPAETADGLAELYRFTTLREFIDTWILTTNCLRTADDFRRITVDYAGRAAALGAAYIEAIFSPAERARRGVDWDELFTGYCEGAAEAEDRFGVTVRLTPDLYRGVDVALAEECARVAVRYAGRGVVGLGLGGAPSAMPLAAYDRALRTAADGGLAFLPHAGEADDAESVREVLPYRPRRIRHGIGARHQPDLLAEIVERGIVLDVCPTSNVCTGAVPELAAHPLPQLVAAGVRCTIGTDDPAMFGTDLQREYDAAAALGLSATEAWRAGLAGAACEEPVRARLAALPGPGRPESRAPAPATPVRD
ncbi:adenosine deaminase [Streptomyces sp. NBRC 110611]|uniref:adenosine deaminase n=1 Tax=Streptomyces sp. NBRC 110611 TaxID=1621259 RepID=UPI000830400B|nr:adenosine deaminase [Streptomyces sp. NBRC 110611]GAU66497.1 adenosine deaminase [Streptomyces sp. NBRC 110611]